MWVLGIDPGSASTGYGLVRLEGARIEHVRSGAIRVPRSRPFAERLHRIHTELTTILEDEPVAEMAVEDVYQGVNARTASRLGHVRGVVLLAAAEAGLPAAEYPPNAVKSAVAGNGLATKEQVRLMVQRILDLTDEIESDDQSDALAVAICHCHRLALETPR